MNSPMTEIAPQTKKIFAKESQALTHELKNRILELDISLPNFQQQVDSLITTIQLLQDAAIKANFYIPNSALAEIIHNFKESINLLRDRHTDIDWITKELLVELINMINQVINEYCLGLNLAKDWIKLQHNLFAQTNKHLQLETNDVTSQIISELYGREHEPFNLEDTPEALHLFDLDFDLDSNLSEDLSEDFYTRLTASLDNLDGLLMIQIDQEDNYLESSQALPESSASSSDELTTLFPSLLTNFFTGNLDELDKDSQEINKASNEERLPMPELLANIFPATATEGLLANDDETELQGVKWQDPEGEDTENLSVSDNHFDNIWTKFTPLDSWSRKNEEELVPAFDLSDFELSSEEDDITDSAPLQTFFESLDRSISNLDSEQNLPLEQSGQFILPNDLNLDSGSLLVEMLKDDFPASDIDTSIEESPIYQNNVSEMGSDWNDLSVINFGDKEISYADFSALSLDAKPEKDLDMSASNQSEVQITSKGNNDATIRLPLNHLEMLGDLSEELLVRKGSLDIYLEEIKTLSGDAQKHLQLLEPSVDSQNQVAIAGLQNAVEQIVNVLALTEQQAYAMSQDVYHLRKNLRQVLKHPISSLVRKFPRILRDLSLQYGKQVELIVQGAEIEVERLISEIITEPLELLLRNAFKNGIESAADRQKQGKVSQGKIEFIATQTDASTIIKVSDDGCGIDIEKIRNQVEQSAAIAGMSGFSTMDMSDQQLINLIFEPSFNLTYGNSHTETGTKLCNIKKKLREFGGTISVQSERGKGTQFTLVLPNILSLIRVLLIDINQMCLAIPSKMILEVIPCNYHDHDFEEQETLRWRDRVLPIVRLNSSMKLNCRYNSSQASLQSNQFSHSNSSLESQKPAHAVPSLLVIHYENNLFALQTDGCWHDQEATFHQIEGDIILPQIFLGTVVLGSNQAVALLNPAELARKCLDDHDPLNNLLVSPAPHSNVENLSSLSDFFGAGDTLPQPSLENLLVTTERTVEPSLERSPEPENLESSGLFTSELANSQTKRSHQPRVLIVDSSANVRRYLAMTLTKAGFLTEQVPNGKEAIAFLKECLETRLNIDVVITDLEMPHMDGFKLLSNIRADANLQNLPIIVLTAKNHENDQKLALELGAKAYFSKPYREQELIKKLDQLVSG